MWLKPKYTCGIFTYLCFIPMFSTTTFLKIKFSIKGVHINTIKIQIQIYRSTIKIITLEIVREKGITTYIKSED